MGGQDEDEDSGRMRKLGSRQLRMGWCMGRDPASRSRSILAAATGTRDERTRAQDKSLSWVEMRFPENRVGAGGGGREGSGQAARGDDGDEREREREGTRPDENNARMVIGHPARRDALDDPTVCNASFSWPVYQWYGVYASDQRLCSRWRRLCVARVHLGMAARLDLRGKEGRGCCYSKEYLADRGWRYSTW